MFQRTSIEKAIPGVTLLFHYDRSQLKNDALAALVVAVVLIPSAIAYSDLAKCAPAAGLYASVAGMVVYGIFASSRHVIVGPDAAIALLVGSAIGPLAANDPGKAVALATVLAFLTAGVLLLMAGLRLGIAADFLSSPALLGFMNGAAVVIIGSQIGKLCGISLAEDNTLLRFWEWGSRLRQRPRSDHSLRADLCRHSLELPVETTQCAGRGGRVCAGNRRWPLH